MGGLYRKIRLFDQMRSNDAVDNPQHPAHDRRTAGKQEKTENFVQLFAKVEKVLGERSPTSWRNSGWTVNSMIAWHEVDRAARLS